MLAPEVQYHGDIRYIDLRRELLYVEPSPDREIGIMRLSAPILVAGSECQVSQSRNGFITEGLAAEGFNFPGAAVGAMFGAFAAKEICQRRP
jgi:hypothetical protein